MQIRIVKDPPAPLIDGRDVRRFSADRERQIQSRIGDDLIVAGDAVPIESARKRTRRDFDCACT